MVRSFVGTMGVVLLLILLGACARTDRDRPTSTAQDALAHYLLGGWVLKGQSCQSDSGVIYRADRSWYSDGASGTWHFEGNKLVFLVTEDEDEIGRTQRLASPVRYVEQVEVAGNNEYIARRPDGTTRQLVRCPA